MTSGTSLHGAVVLVTGASRGLGAHFVREALDRGARTVYATARRPETVDVTDRRVVALRLDVTDPASVAAAAAVVEEAGTGLDLLVNNAGIATATDLVTGSLDAVRAELDVHFWGALAVTRAFAPLLATSGDGEGTHAASRSTVLAVLSTLSFRVFPGNGAYAAAKAAAWMLANSARLELAAQGTNVVALHVSSVDTDMMAGWDVPKSSPTVVVAQALDGVEAGVAEVLADDETRAVKALLSAPPEALYAPFTSGDDTRRVPGTP